MKTGDLVHLKENYIEGFLGDESLHGQVFEVLEYNKRTGLVKIKHETGVVLQVPPSSLVYDIANIERPRRERVRRQRLRRDEVITAEGIKRKEKTDYLLNILNKYKQ